MLIVRIKAMCRKAGIAKLDGGPKGATIQFHNEKFASPGGLVAFLEDQRGLAKIRDNKINIVHDYLDNLEGVGKVLSFSSIVKVGEQLNDGKKLETLELGILYTKLPDAIKTEIIDPYISIEDNEARINVRIKDSKENLRRNELIKKINSDLENKLGFKKEEYKLAGVLILFNNLLQSLFKSQILTLGFVMVGIFTMFLVLFRNLWRRELGNRHYCWGRY